MVDAISELLQILGSVESIEAYLDDHLVKTQTMRGSPYFKPFEAEVLGWEAQLTRSVHSHCLAAHVCVLS